jgi:hypothetical protein
MPSVFSNINKHQLQLNIFDAELIYALMLKIFNNQIKTAAKKPRLFVQP